MIKIHEFNTLWVGKPVGIITDDVFFLLPPLERENLLRNYYWVEYAGLSSSLCSRKTLSNCGFYYADSQIQFRLDLRKTPQTSTGNEMEFEAYDKRHFDILSEEMRPFRHERFYLIPGLDTNSITRRYSIWANRLLVEHPQTCIAGYLHNTLQGWFLSRRVNSMIELTLAVLKKDAVVSGFDFYSGAFEYYRSQGFRFGAAGFSITNIDVHNIYASSGARFTEPREIWLFHG